MAALENNRSTTKQRPPRSAVQPMPLVCSACRSDHDVQVFVPNYVGFCGDCLDQSRMHAPNELGGEA